jgi:hypothetical protein
MMLLLLYEPAAQQNLLPAGTSAALRQQQCLSYPAAQELLLSAAELRSHR